MDQDTLSRRHFLGTLGAAALWLHALADAPTTALADDTALVTFTPAQAADLDAFAAQIIPSGDDGLGAREAGAVFFIDRALAGFAKAQRPLFDAGLAELRARKFATLSPAAQIGVMREMDESTSEFFAAARAAVITGTFADPKYGGNRRKIGWRLLGFDDRFHWMPPFGWYDREENRAS